MTVAALALLPKDFRRHWPKRLAAATGVPVSTAKFWVFRRVPAARRREVALAALAECRRVRGMIEEMERALWAEVADEMAEGKKVAGPAMGCAPGIEVYGCDGGALGPLG